MFAAIFEDTILASGETIEELRDNLIIESDEDLKFIIEDVTFCKIEVISKNNINFVIKSRNPF